MTMKFRGKEGTPIQHLQDADATIEKLNAEIIRRNAADNAKAAATPPPKTGADIQAEYNALTDPRERAAFRAAHKKELGL